MRAPGARPMDMRSRPVEGFVYVDPAVLDDKTLRDWLQLALTFVRTLPAKPHAEGPCCRDNGSSGRPAAGT